MSFFAFFSRIKLGVKKPSCEMKRQAWNEPSKSGHLKRFLYFWKRLFLSWENTLSVCLCNDPVLKIKANGFFPFYPKIVRKKVRNVRVLLRSWTEPHKEKTMDAKNFQQRTLFNQFSFLWRKSPIIFSLAFKDGQQTELICDPVQTDRFMCFCNIFCTRSINYCWKLEWLESIVFKK